MTLRIGFPAYALMALAAVLQGACSGEREPAQKMLVEIEATLSAASPDAAKYLPDQWNDVRTRLHALQASFDKRDYSAVVNTAPPVLRAAAQLAGAAAKKKADVMKGLDESWARTASTVPAYLAAVQRRLDELSKSTGRAALPGVDLGAARSSCGEAASLWSKATGAFANRNMEQAVSTAQAAQARLVALAGTLKMALPEADSGPGI